MLSKINKTQIISIIMALVLTIFLWHNLLLSGNNIIILFVFVACYAVIRYSIKLAIPLKQKSPYIIAFLFATAELIGKSINTDYTLNFVIDKWILINFLGYFIVSWILIRIVYNFFENSKLNYSESNKKIINNKIAIFFICVILMIVAWIPYFLRFYPGVLTPDSYSQLQQAIGIAPLSNHHPIAHTAIVAFFVNIGFSISNNINVGIAFYTMGSMIIMAMLDATVIIYLIKKKTPNIVTIVLLLFYMFYPINGMYSITMWKDVIFSGIIPIFIILCIELITNTDSFLSKKKNIFVFILFTILTMILRHNGVYIVILSMPFMFFVLRKFWKTVLPMFLAVIVCYLGINFIILNVLKASKGSVGEMLSIPLQQIARVEKNHREEIDNETKIQINNFFTVQNIGDKYYPLISDDVKSNLNTEYFEANKMEFINLWFKLLTRYPKDYVESFISNSYGYYYPEASSWTVGTEARGEEIGVLREPKIDNGLINFFVSIPDRRDIPILSMAFSIGAICWTTLICFGYKIYKKDYKYIVIYLPIFILWLTLIASPVFCEFRYAYPILLALPVFVSTNLIKKEN